MDRQKHPHLANALRDLKTRFHVEAGDLTPDEWYELVECVRRVENPFADVNADAIGTPVRVCEGLYLWRLSAGASAWLDDFAAVWWGDGRNETRYFWALCYALSNARNREAFVVLDTPDKAYKAIRKWVLRCPATRRELEDAIDRTLGRAEPTGGASRPAQDRQIDWAQVAARLEGKSGISGLDWLWNRSASYTLRAYNDLAVFAKRYSAASGKDGTHMKNELDTACDALVRLLARIGRRVAEQRKEASGTG